MKTEYIALTPVGAAALFAAGVLAGNLLFSAAGASRGETVATLIMLILLLLMTRADAAEPISTGNYDRRLLWWRRTGPLK